MFNNVVTYIKTNKKLIAKKALVISGSIAGAAAAWVLLTQANTTEMLEAEVQEDGSFAVPDTESAQDD